MLCACAVTTNTAAMLSLMVTQASAGLLFKIRFGLDQRY
jgi:hypothetical protein